MFIRSGSPPACGTLLDIQLETKHGAVPFAKGVVTFALAKHRAGNAARAPGFGVRFIELPARSRALVDDLVSGDVDRKEMPRIHDGRRPLAFAVVIALGLVTGAVAAGAVASAQAQPFAAAHRPAR